MISINDNEKIIFEFEVWLDDSITFMKFEFSIFRSIKFVKINNLIHLISKISSFFATKFIKYRKTLEFCKCWFDWNWLYLRSTVLSQKQRWWLSSTYVRIGILYFSICQRGRINWPMKFLSINKYLIDTNDVCRNLFIISHYL